MQEILPAPTLTNFFVINRFSERQTRVQNKFRKNLTSRGHFTSNLFILLNSYSLVSGSWVFFHNPAGVARIPLFEIGQNVDTFSERVKFTSVKSKRSFPCIVRKVFEIKLLKFNKNNRITFNRMIISYLYFMKKLISRKFISNPLKDFFCNLGLRKCVVIHSVPFTKTWTE